MNADLLTAKTRNCGNRKTRRTEPGQPLDVKKLKRDLADKSGDERTPTWISASPEPSSRR